MNDVLKIVKPLKKSVLLTKGFSETIKNETKEQKGELLRMLLGTWDASLLGIFLTGKYSIKAGKRAIATTRGRDTSRAGGNF